MAEHEILVGIEIDGRKRQIELTTLKQGKGRHLHYGTLRQAPPEVRGEALLLIREALQNSGYDSLAELDEALTSDLVVPEPDEE